MKLPNWFKITWWLLLMGLTGLLLIKRLDAITSGNSVTADLLILLIFVALTLVPIFVEIEFFGIKFKKEIEDLKHDVNLKFGDFKNEIRNSQTQTVHQTIQAYGPPPPDNKLPEIEIEIERILKAKLKEHGLTTKNHIDSSMDVPGDNVELFKVRYNIETQIRRIWAQRFDRSDFEQRQQHQPVIKIIQELTTFEIIDNNFYDVLREILSICNYAIHGKTVTSKQVHFVIKNAKPVLDYLSKVK